MFVVLASGIGKRFKSETPKQFVKIGEETLLEKTLKAVVKLSTNLLVVTYPKGFKEVTQKITEKFTNVLKIRLVEGGATRRESVKKALESIEIDDEEIVAIHDGARLFIDPDRIKTCIEKTKEYGAAVLATPVSETVAVVENGVIKNVPNRKLLWSVKTPQCFKYAIIKKAHEFAEYDGIDATDDSSLVLKYHLSEVVVVEDFRFNIKVTYPEDMKIVTFIEKLLKNGG